MKGIGIENIKSEISISDKGNKGTILIVRYKRQINELTKFNGKSIPTNIKTVGIDPKAANGSISLSPENP